MFFPFLVHPPTQCLFTTSRRPSLHWLVSLVFFPVQPTVSRRSPSSPQQLGSAKVNSWAFFEARSTLLRLFRVSTLLSTVFTGLPASLRHLPFHHRPLTRRCVCSTRRLVSSSGRSTRRPADSSSRLSTFSSADDAVCRVFCCFSACIFDLLLFCCCFCLSVLYVIPLYFLLGFVSFSLPLLLWFISTAETSATGDSTPLYSDPDSVYDSGAPASVSLGRLWLLLGGSADGFGPHEVLTPVIRVYEPLEVCDSSCAPFAFETALCGPFERTGSFICPISYCFVLTLLYFVFGFVVGEATPFRYFDSL